MPSTAVDARKHTLTIGARTIPLSGDGIFARISNGTVGTVERGAALSIFTKPGEPEGVLTVTAFNEDDAFGVLYQTYNERRVEGGEDEPLPGSATKKSVGNGTTTTITCTWDNALITDLADVVIGPDTETGDFVFSLVNLQTEVTT